MLKAMFSMSSALMRGWSVSGVEIAIDAQVRIVPDLQVQVGGAALHGDAQQVVNIHAERTPATLAMMTRSRSGYEMTEVMRLQL